jgi:predicted nucleic acid-binding protein
MNRRIILDSGVLSLVTHLRPSSESKACRAWINAILTAGDEVFIPEVTDYEVRREYLRRNNQHGIRTLDAFAQQWTYLPLSTAHWRWAAALWAVARNQGHITAPVTDLNIDILLAAQAQLLATPTSPVIIATTNVRHLAPFADARRWPDI